MFREQLGTRDDARLAEGRQAHRLRRIELGVLERSQAHEAVHQRLAGARPVDVDLIAQARPRPAGKRALDRWLLAAAGRRRGHGSSSSSVDWKPHADDLPRAGSFGHDRHAARRVDRRPIVDRYAH